MAVFGNTQTVVLPVGTKVLVKVNSSDKYSSEYFLREGLTSWRMIIRHSRPNAKAFELPVERHNVELTQSVAPTAPATLTEIRKVYFVFENPVGQLAGGITSALFNWALANTSEAIDNLHQWQS